MAVCDPVRPIHTNEHLLCQIATINTMPSPVDVETRLANIENNYKQEISHLTGQLQACVARNSALEAKFVQFERLDLGKEAAIVKHDEMMADFNLKYSQLKREHDELVHFIQEMKEKPESQMDIDQLPPPQEHASVARSPLGPGEVVGAAPPAVGVAGVEVLPPDLAAVGAVPAVPVVAPLDAVVEVVRVDPLPPAVPPVLPTAVSPVDAVVEVAVGDQAGGQVEGQAGEQAEQGTGGDTSAVSIHL